MTLSHVRLNLADDRGEDAGREKSGPERTGRILTERRQATKSRPGFDIHVIELPANLVFERIRPFRVRQRGGFRGIGGCPESMRTHVSDGSRLRGGPRGRHPDGRLRLPGGTPGDEALADLLGGAEFTAGKRSRTSDCISGPVILRSLGLEGGQSSLSAVRSPPSDDAAISFAQRLNGDHMSTISCRPQADPTRGRDPQSRTPDDSRT